MSQFSGNTPKDELARLLPVAIFWSVFAYFLARYLLVQLVGLHIQIAGDSARAFWAFFIDPEHPARMVTVGYAELLIGLLCFEHLRRRGVEDCVLQAGRFGMLSIYLAAFATLVVPEIVFRSVIMFLDLIGREVPRLTTDENAGYFPPNQLLGLFISAVIIAPVVEEFLFRGFLMTSMEARGWPSWLIVILSSAAFTILHIGYTGFGLMFIFMLGCMFGALRLWSGGLILPMAAHAAFNMKTFLFSYFNAYG
jgi:membrane protease YdiL (CAAX protease family)